MELTDRDRLIIARVYRAIATKARNWNRCRCDVAYTRRDKHQSDCTWVELDDFADDLERVARSVEGPGEPIRLLADLREGVENETEDPPDIQDHFEDSMGYLIPPQFSPFKQCTS